MWAHLLLDLATLDHLVGDKPNFWATRVIPDLQFAPDHPVDKCSVRIGRIAQKSEAPRVILPGDLIRKRERRQPGPALSGALKPT